MAQSIAVENTTPKALNAGVWVLQVAAAAMFAMAGFAKLSGAPDMVALFEAVGVGQWFRYVTGVAEVGGALLLLVPALCGAGALLLAGVMAGAIATHLFVIGGSAAFPSVLLAVVLVIAFVRRERTLRLLGR
jgi:uncharacterized membrane protein YphA (DoxX/SURF4 family)